MVDSLVVNSFVVWGYLLCDKMRLVKLLANVFTCGMW